MTRQAAKQIFALDRAMIGFLVLVFGIGGSWATLQYSVKANAEEIASVSISYKAADASLQSGNQIRFARIEAVDSNLIRDMTGQAILLERIVTTTEFIQRDLSKLVDQAGD